MEADKENPGLLAQSGIHRGALVNTRSHFKRKVNIFQGGIA